MFREHVLILINGIVVMIARKRGLLHQAGNFIGFVVALLL